MSLIRDSIPKFEWDDPTLDLEWEAPEGVISQWRAYAAEQDDDDALDMFDIIGEDWFTGEGVTDKKVARYLNSKKGREIKVRLNSPGGDVFAGLTIYNLLRGHNAKVTVEILGMAASAASVIAMAADEIIMAEGSLMMIHNSWGLALGNKHDMRSTADILAKIDDGMIGVYAARTGKSEKAIAKMMDEETWLSADEAVDGKFADKVDEANKVSAKAAKTDMDGVLTKRKIEHALARMDVPRNKRSEITSLILADGAPRDASTTPEAERDAGKPKEVAAFMSDLIDIFK